jgi:replicative DNA helicase
MRNINENECLLLASLIKYPELVYAFDDLTRIDFTSDYPFIIYDTIKNTDLEKLKQQGFYSLMHELRQSKKLDSSEFMFAIEDFGQLTTEITSYNADNAYKFIKLATLEQKFVNKLNPILRQRMDITERVNSISDLVDTVKDNIVEEEIIVRATDIKITKSNRVISTGIEKIDNKVLITDNYLVIIASRPFNGKTSFACHFAMHNTTRGKILFYSLEMNKAQIASKLKRYGTYYKPDNFLIIEKTQANINQIVRTAKKEKPVAIFIDQFNKLKMSGNTEYERFTAMAKKLKIYAGVLKVPIVCLAQINRSATNNMPCMHNLKGSGSLEEEADVCFILHVKNRESKETILKVDKNRSLLGYLGEVDLRHNPETNFYEPV